MTGFSNEDIAEFLRSLVFLMEVEGNQNPFRIRSFSKAADIISEYPTPLTELNKDELEKIRGIGKGIATLIDSFCREGTCHEWEEITALVPESLLELKGIRGLGPGRIKKLWKEAGIKTIRNLKKTAAQNPLLLESVLGKATAAKIIKELEFIDRNKGKKLYFQVEPFVREFLEKARKHCPDLMPAEDLFTMESVISELKFYASVPENIPDALIEEIKNKTGLPFGFTEHFIHTPKETILGSPIFINSVRAKVQNEKQHLDHILNKVMQFSPELRYVDVEVLWNKPVDDLIAEDDLCGIVHSHSTWSDGRHSIEEMARACMEKGWQWLVISDHSKSAFYANGLTEERITEQKKEIGNLNKKLSGFRVIHGIECDILKDGSMDYPDDILKAFEVVIASVHTGLQMKEDEATKRIIKAIENPNVHILGHLTGRLLLEREGYPVNHEKIIDACAANGVCIELNTNPYRLDIDFRWIEHCISKGVRLCLSPDAHSVEGLYDILYGIKIARKGFMTKVACLNLLSAEDFLNCIRKK